MPPDLVTVLVFQGREYRALQQAELAMQQQVRSLLRKLHAAMDQERPDTQDVAVHTAPGHEGDHLAFALHTSSVPSCPDTSGAVEISAQERPGALTHCGSISAASFVGPEDDPSEFAHQMWSVSSGPTSLNGAGEGQWVTAPQAISALPAPLPLSQEGGQIKAASQRSNVPAWLSTPPRGMARADWHPWEYLMRSVAAQVLYGHAEALHHDVLARRNQLEALTQQLPLWADWAEGIRGVSAYGLGLILSETGDLWHYPTVAKVWKRMGVGLWNGERQRRHANVTEAEALAIGYVPRRRAVVYMLQKGLIMQNKLPSGEDGPYYALYLERKAIEEMKAPELTKLAWDRRAGRYMAKRFLRHLWSAWRRSMPRTVTEEREVVHAHP